MTIDMPEGLQRVTLNVQPMFLVPPDADISELSRQFYKAVKDLPGFESLIQRRTTITEPLSGICRVGGHRFYLPEYWASRAVPNICRDHWDQEWERQANDDHAPLWEALAEYGLRGFIYNSGGGTETIRIPLGDDDWADGPHYLALREGEVILCSNCGKVIEHDDDGAIWYHAIYCDGDDDRPRFWSEAAEVAEPGEVRWIGSAGFYRSLDDENPDEVFSDFEEGLTPSEWARLIAEDWARRKEAIYRVR